MTVADKTTPATGTSLPAVALLTLIFVLMALPGVGVEPWGDELTTEQWASRTYSELGSSRYAHKTYALLAKASMDLTGDSMFALRLPARLFALGSVIVMFHIGRRLRNDYFGFGLAVLFLATPEFWIRASDGRGYSAVVFFLAAILLAAASATRISLGRLTLILALGFLGYLFHPTALLALPPILTLAARDVWVGWKSNERSESIGKQTFYIAFNVACLIALAYLVFPYFRDYFAYRTLNIPKAYVESDRASLPFPSFFSWVGFTAHISPIFAARGVTGFPLLLTGIPFLVGFVGMLRTDPRRWSIYCAPILFILGIPLLLGIEFIPQRYLAAALPFQTLTTLYGLLWIVEWAAGRLGAADRPLVRRSIFAAFLGLALLPNLGPLAAELVHPLKPGTHPHRSGDLSVRPTLKILSSPYYRDWLVVSTSRGFVPDNTRRTYGVDPSRSAILPELTSERIEEFASSHAGTDARFVLIVDDGERAEVEEPPSGFREVIDVDLMEKNLRFFVPESATSEHTAVEMAGPIVETVLDSKGLSSLSDWGVSALAEEAGLQEEAEALADRARRRATLLRRLDYRNRSPEWVPYFANFYRSQGDLDGALGVYRQVLGKYPYSPRWYVEVLRDFDVEERTEILSRLDVKEFADGYRRAVEIHYGHSPEYQRFWTFQIARYMYVCDAYEGALEFCRLTKEFGNEDRYVTELQFHMLRELGRLDEAASLVLEEGVDEQLPYGMYDHAIKTIEAFKEFKSRVEDWDANKERLIDNVVAALREDESTSLDDKLYSSYWLGMWLVSNREAALARKCFLYRIELGDPEGKAALVLQWIAETGGRGEIVSRPR